MDCFIINRYTGEKPEIEPQETPDHLSALLKKIELRKQQKAAGITAVPAEQPEPIVQIKTKKSRKRKAVKNNETEVAKQEKLDNNLKEPNDETEEQPKETSKKTEAGTKETESKEQKKHDFMILGSQKHAKKKVVKRVLPDWLAKPELVSLNLESGPTLEETESMLDSNLIDCLRNNNVNRLFPVQARVVSWLLECDSNYKMGRWVRDTCVSAPTGSGKTLSYALPIIQILQTRFIPAIRCLVVLPVQELASQVYKVIVKYSSHTNLKVGLISGSSLFEDDQSRLIMKTDRGEYASRIDILVATPGRLIDHIQETPGFSLASLRFLVIDEADRETDWLQYIPEPHCRPPPLTIANIRKFSVPPAQKILLSATLSQDPEKLSRLGLFQPILFTSALVADKDDDVDLDKEAGSFVGRFSVPSELTERIIECSAQHKPLALYQLLVKKNGVEKALVFTNSSTAAHNLATLIQLLLGEKTKVAELSAQLTPKQREDTLMKFARGEIGVLVSSDALARGLDIPGVKLVVSYDLPKYIKGYIHRSGRTGRAGIPGTAVSILMPNQVAFFEKMLKDAHRTPPSLEKEDLEGIAEATEYEKHLQSLHEILSKERTDEVDKMKSTKRKVKSIQ